MLDIVLKIVIPIATSALIGIGTWLITQIRKYNNLIKKEEDSTIKATFTAVLEDKLEPICKDIGNMKNDIANLQTFETNFQTRLQPTQEEIEHLKDDITEIINTLKAQGVDLQNIKSKEEHLEHETRCAWRYRIRTLCHAYIQRGWMSHDEFSQLQEMYNLYTAIGGNGQTKELYERTMRLDIKTEAEIVAILEAQKK